MQKFEVSFRWNSKIEQNTLQKRCLCIPKLKLIRFQSQILQFFSSQGNYCAVNYIKIPLLLFIIIEVMKQWIINRHWHSLSASKAVKCTRIKSLNVSCIKRTKILICQCGKLPALAIIPSNISVENSWFRGFTIDLYHHGKIICCGDTSRWWNHETTYFHWDVW